MRTKEVVRMVSGSVTIYVVVAACSGGASRSTASSHDGGGVPADAMARHDSAASPEDSAADRILDALTDPVAEASADNANQSGTRLKVQRNVGSDGSSSFVSLYDSQLKTACGWMAASDATTRCLPDSGANFGTVTLPSTVAQANVYFADPACSVPLAASGSCTPPTYATILSSSSCPTTERVFSVAGPYSGTVYWGSPCTATTSTGAAKLYSLGAELPPAMFVQATLTTDP